MKRSILMAGVAAAGVVVGAGGTLTVQQLDFGPSPDRAEQNYLDTLHEVAPAGTTIDDSQVMGGARRGCEAGPMGSLGLMQELMNLDFTNAAVTEEVMPAFAEYCDAIGLPVTVQDGYSS